MKILALLALLAISSDASGAVPRGEDRGQSTNTGKPAFGVTISIKVENPPVAKGSPFLVSVVVRNVSGSKVDLKAISAFDLRSASRTSPETAGSFGNYWCPIDLMSPEPAEKKGLILASPSDLVLSKGASLNATIDLTRHGWERTTSSWWPVREFSSVVGPGTYILRLDIQVGGGKNSKWIRSNEIRVVVGK